MEFREEVGDTKEAVLSLAGLARASLKLGDLAGAASSVDKILSHFNEQGVYVIDEPITVFLTC